METGLLKGNVAIARAVDLLKEEKVVALPTETVYGLAGNAFSQKAVASIFEAKNRPLTDPLIVHLLDASWLDLIAILNPDLKKTVDALAAAFWPGPLTLLLPRSTAIPDLITAGFETVAVRVPAHKMFRNVLTQLDFPLAAPSANRFGRISPTTAENVMKELGGRIPFILDGGTCDHGLESTIVWPHDNVLQILRPGPITAEMLAPFGKVVTETVEGKVPGSLKSHYAPRKKLSWYDPMMLPQKDQGILAFSENKSGFAHTEILSTSGNLKEAAANLYGALRRLDESEATSLLVEKVPEVELGVAIMDRLRRAVS